MTTRVRWLLAGSVALGATLGALTLFGACSTREARVGPGAAPAQPFGSATNGTAPLAKGAPLADHSESIDLEQFTPLLALPELSAAKTQVEAGQPRAAALEVERVLREHPPTAAGAPRWQMLLAKLREQAGAFTEAALAYEAAAKAQFPLTGYARLGHGRALHRAGRHVDAIQKLEHVPAEQPIGSDARVLIAQAALAMGNEELAVVTWRRHLESSDDPEQWAPISLELAKRLLGREGGATEALRLARRVASRKAADERLTGEATELERQALALLPAGERARLWQPGADDQLAKLRALVEARQGKAALETGDTLLARLPAADKYAPIGCEAGLERGKALALDRQWGRAADTFVDLIRYCNHDPDYRARLLFLAGKYAASDKRYTLAVQRYEQLEKELPNHRLSDDARLNAALAYLEVGVEARFTELLSRMPDDYAGGDMLLEGMFRLALRRIEKGDWSGAASVLDRAANFAQGSDSARGHEFSGRERYFRARAWMHTGERERGIAELDAIVRELPLSYYMLHAYARLHELDAARAGSAMTEALAQAGQQPFAFERRPEFELPGFQRGMELLRQGETELAKRELDALAFRSDSAAPSVFWGMALLYARAGAARESHAIARGLLTDWLRRWPAGDWTKAWEIGFPRPHRAIVEREAKKNGVPEALVYAVMREESAFDASAVSTADAYGLMQLIVPTAKTFAKPAGLPWDPESLKRPPINIALGSRVLKKLRAKFSDNPWLAIPGYNAGPGRPERWLRERPNLDFDVWVETIPFLETRRYTKRVLASYAAYAFLYDREHAAPALMLPAKLSPPKTD